jgi:hypothetical protein
MWRLGEIVLGHNVEKILGIPKISAGTGQMQTDEVFRLLSGWDLVQNITAMSFDTTASNTGVRNGVFPAWKGYWSQFIKSSL